jgi:hypothetical protein
MLNTIFNNTKYVNLSITLGGLIWINEKDLHDILTRDNIELGSTYNFIITDNKVPLTKDGVPFECVKHTIPNNYNYIKDYIYNDNYIHTNNFNYITSQCMWFNLSAEISRMIRESDLIKKIYAEKDIDYEDILVPKSVFENYVLNLELGYSKNI